MSGMDKNTGKTLSGRAATMQNVWDRILTPKGSRLGRRDYGSDLFKFLDTAIVKQIDITATIAQALDPEPNYEFKSLNIKASPDGKLSLFLNGVYVPEGLEIKEERRL